MKLFNKLIINLQKLLLSLAMVSLYPVLFIAFLLFQEGDILCLLMSLRVSCVKGRRY